MAPVSLSRFEACAAAALNILCRDLWLGQDFLKQDCSQKKEPGIPSFLQVGHTILPGLLHPSDAHVGNVAAEAMVNPKML